MGIEEQMLGTLELVSITDFILAAQCLFLSGILFGKVKSQMSRKGMLSYFLLFVGLSALMGGIDHGFFEPINERYIPRTLTYLFIAGATFFLFKYTIKTYFSGKGAQVLISIAYVQLILFSSASFFYHSFVLVVANYSPVLILFFALNLWHYKRSKSELKFALFCLIMIMATLIQVFEIGVSRMVNGDTFFHIIAFIGYFFFFSGVKSISEEAG